MNPLLYSSNEMFSSTELIRKSKMIFDKLLKSEIEKAIILRDGKPGFMLLDFEKYEELMKEYLELKENASKPVQKEEVITQKEPEVVIPVQKEDPIVQEPEEIIENKKEEPEEVGFSMNASAEEQFEHIEDDISEDDLKKALEDIESLSFDDDKTKDKKEEPLNLDEDDLDELSFTRKKEQPLKEFWD